MTEYEKGVYYPWILHSFFMVRSPFLRICFLVICAPLLTSCASGVDANLLHRESNFPSDEQEWRESVDQAQEKFMIPEFRIR